MKLKKGDEVLVVAGKDKGKKGKILRALPKDNKVVVENINQFKRHVKARRQGQKSEIITITKPINVANVSLVDAKSKKPTRIGYKMVNKEKVRIAKRSGQKI